MKSNKPQPKEDKSQPNPAYRTPKPGELLGYRLNKDECFAVFYAPKRKERCIELKYDPNATHEALKKHFHEKTKTVKSVLP